MKPNKLFSKDDEDFLIRDNSFSLEELIRTQKNFNRVISQTIPYQTNNSYLTFNTYDGLYCSDINIDLENDQSAYESALSEIGPYFQEFLNSKGKELLPTQYEGAKKLQENVLGQSEIRSDGFRPIDAKVSLSEDMISDLKNYDELGRLKDSGYEVMADGALLGVLYHELIHSTGELDEVKTRELTKEFFDWFRDNYTQPGSLAYDKATIASEIGGAPLTPDQAINYPVPVNYQNVFDYAA